MVELDDSVLDATRFEQMFDHGRDAARGGNHALAASRLERALSALAAGLRDLAYGTLHMAKELARGAPRAATEERIEVSWSSGARPASAGAPTFVSANLLRERLQALMILALYRQKADRRLTLQPT